MKNLINNGSATSIWNGIPHDYLVRRCEQATAEEASAMSTAVALMVAGECSHEEWEAALRALHGVEQRLSADWEREHGEPVRNRHGQILGGVHPALRQDLYEEALRNRARHTKPVKDADSLNDVANALLRAIKDGGVEETDGWAYRVITQATQARLRKARRIVEDYLGARFDPTLWSMHFSRKDTK